jgi:hypothetical protein
VIVATVAFFKCFAAKKVMGANRHLLKKKINLLSFFPFSSSLVLLLQKIVNLFIIINNWGTKCCSIRTRS